MGARGGKGDVPVVSEIARVRTGTATDLLGTILCLIPGFLWTVYGLSGGMFEPINISNFASRLGGGGTIHLGMPAFCWVSQYLLVPGVLTILLAGGAKSPDGDAWSARELADLEATRSVLAWGLAWGPSSRC